MHATFKLCTEAFWGEKTITDFFVQFSSISQSNREINILTDKNPELKL